MKQRRWGGRTRHKSDPALSLFYGLSRRPAIEDLGAGEKIHGLDQGRRSMRRRMRRRTGAKFQTRGAGAVSGKRLGGHRMYICLAFYYAWAAIRCMAAWGSAARWAGSISDRGRLRGAGSKDSSVGGGGCSGSSGHPCGVRGNSNLL